MVWGYNINYGTYGTPIYCTSKNTVMISTGTIINLTSVLLCSAQKHLGLLINIHVICLIYNIQIISLLFLPSNPKQISTFGVDYKTIKSFKNCIWWLDEQKQKITYDMFRDNGIFCHILSAVLSGWHKTWVLLCTWGSWTHRSYNQDFYNSL